MTCGKRGHCCGSSFPGGLPAVLDPFCGGGTTLVEAQRLGLKTEASDLNPVPALITPRSDRSCCRRSRGKSRFIRAGPLNSTTNRTTGSSRQVRVTPERSPFGGVEADVEYYASAKSVKKRSLG